MECREKSVGGNAHLPEAMRDELIVLKALSSELDFIGFEAKFLLKSRIVPTVTAINEGQG